MHCTDSDRRLCVCVEAARCSRNNDAALTPSTSPARTSPRARFAPQHIEVRELFEARDAPTQTPTTSRSACASTQASRRDHLTVTWTLSSDTSFDARSDTDVDRSHVFAVTVAGLRRRRRSSRVGLLMYSCRRARSTRIRRQRSLEVSCVVHGAWSPTATASNRLRFAYVGAHSGVGATAQKKRPPGFPSRWPSVLQAATISGRRSRAARRTRPDPAVR